MIDSVKVDEQELDDTPKGLQKRWAIEFAAAKREFEPFWKVGDEVVRALRGEPWGVQSEDDVLLPIFAANVQTQQAIMYGQTPKSTSQRRFADADDDVARVASLIQERHLNTDIEDGSDGYKDALRHALCEHLGPGLAVARVRYRATIEQVQVKAIQNEQTGAIVEAGYTKEQKTDEAVEIDWIYWKDYLCSPARVRSEVRWEAYRSLVPRKGLRKQFGHVEGLDIEAIPLAHRRADEDRDRKEYPWDRAELWEIWDKETGKVLWFVEGFDRILEVKPDFYGLKRFFPTAGPWGANVDTSTIIPVPYFKLAQDLYRRANNLATRIGALTDIVGVRGAYNRANPELARLIEERGNFLVPVDDWAMFAEKGGIAGAISYVPLDQVVNAIAVLEQQLARAQDLIFQLTGMSDIIRGQAATTGVTATEQSIKAKFGSVRMQRMQDEFARFASELLSLKAELIAKLFDPQTIIERSNIMLTKDAPLAEQAVQLLKDRHADFRIEVKPEAVSLTDFAALRQERAEVVATMAQVMTAGQPYMALPAGQVFVFETLKFVAAGTKGGQGFEAVIDGMIQEAQAAQQAAAANPQPPEQDPKLAELALKAQSQMALEDKKLETALSIKQADVAAHASMEQTQREQNVLEHQQKTLITNAFKPPSNGGGGFSGGWTP